VLVVVDGSGSSRCALVGDALAELAVKNNWKVSSCCRHCHPPVAGLNNRRWRPMQQMCPSSMPSRAMQVSVLKSSLGLAATGLTGTVSACPFTMCMDCGCCR